MNWSSSYRWFRPAFAVAGIAGLAVALASGWGKIDPFSMPPWHITVLSLGLIASSLVFALRGWVALFDGRLSSRKMAAGYLTSMLGKYIPGGFWQPMGQVLLARSPEVDGGRAIAAFLAHCGTQLAAAGLLSGAFALIAEGITGPVRIAAACGILMLLGVVRPVFRRTLLLVPSRVSRIAAADLEALVPSQSALTRSFLWSLCTLVSSGSALALLVDATPITLLQTTTAFAFAWAVGFLAVPFPSGIAVREAMLVLSVANSANVVAGSALHRLLVMIAEVLLLILVRRFR